MEKKEPILCKATHPNMPNHSGHSRGRVIHAVKEGNKTICNMLVDKIFTDENKHIIQYTRRCQICFKGDINNGFN